MVKKRALPLILVLSFCLALISCAGSRLTRATNAMNSVNSVYEHLPAVYDAALDSGLISKEKYNTVIVPFDKELHDGIQYGWDTLIAIKAGSGDWQSFDSAIDKLALILDHYDVSLPVPEIKAAMIAIKALLRESK